MTNTEEFRRACRMLTRLGITANYAGFYQTAYALAITTRDPSQLRFLTKSLYLDVALQYNTGADCVERNIRKVRSMVWKKNREALFKELGRPLARLTGNARFLAYLTTCLMEEMEAEE